MLGIEPINAAYLGIGVSVSVTARNLPPEQDEGNRAGAGAKKVSLYLLGEAYVAHLLGWAGGRCIDYALLSCGRKPKHCCGMRLCGHLLAHLAVNEAMIQEPDV